MQAKNIKAEVIAKINTMIEEGKPLEPAWLTMAILNDHPGIEGEDADWYQGCTSRFVRLIVGKMVNQVGKMNDIEKEEETPTFPGFARLQEVYIQERRVGNQIKKVAVPIAAMTDEELEEKARYYETMSEGCAEHAREIRRYVAMRTLDEVG